jgi:primosomal protein N' (replication factor Y)
MIQHPIFNYVNEERYLNFYEHEIKNRNQVMYPPCTRFFEIELKHEDELTVRQDAQKVCNALKNASAQIKNAFVILGPSEPPVAKIKNIYSRKMYIKTEHIHLMLTLYKKIDHANYKSSIFFTPNPLS